MYVFKYVYWTKTKTLDSKLSRPVVRGHAKRIQLQLSVRCLTSSSGEPRGDSTLKWTDSVASTFSSKGSMN
jgi:hypothetical protein